MVHCLVLLFYKSIDAAGVVECADLRPVGPLGVASFIPGSPYPTAGSIGHRQVLLLSCNATGYARFYQGRLWSIMRADRASHLLRILGRSFNRLKPYVPASRNGRSTL